jgi:hypothetical protein
MNTRYLVVFRPQSHPNDAPRRLARLLKFAGRSCGLRCVEVSELREDSETSEQTDATTTIPARGCNASTLKSSTDTLTSAEGASVASVDGMGGAGRREGEGETPNVGGSKFQKVLPEEKTVCRLPQSTPLLSPPHLFWRWSFVVGPMCGINRNSAEPPSHKECAQWSARNCPFLSVVAIGAGVAALLYFSNAGNLIAGALKDAFGQIAQIFEFVFSHATTLTQAWADASQVAFAAITSGLSIATSAMKDIWSEFENWMGLMWDRIGIRALQSISEMVGFLQKFLDYSHIPNTGDSRAQAFFTDEQTKLLQDEGNRKANPPATSSAADYLSQGEISGCSGREVHDLKIDLVAGIPTKGIEPA